jgi:hypothetical protein
VKEGDSNLFHRDQWSDVRCSSAEFQRQRVTLIRFIASFFFCLQSSAFWHFRWQKTTSFNDSENKKKLTGSHPGLAGWTGSRVDRVSRANSRVGFCLNPDRSQARVGQVPGRPAGPVQILKLWIWTWHNNKVTLNLCQEKKKDSNPIPNMFSIPKP